MPRASGRGSNAYEDSFGSFDESGRNRRRRRRMARHGSGRRSAIGRPRRPRYEDEFDWDDEVEHADWSMTDTDDADLPVPEDWDDAGDWEEDDVGWRDDAESDRRPEDDL